MLVIIQHTLLSIVNAYQPPKITGLLMAVQGRRVSGFPFSENLRTPISHEVDMKGDSYDCKMLQHECCQLPHIQGIFHFAGTQALHILCFWFQFHLHKIHHMLTMVPMAHTFHDLESKLHESVLKLLLHACNHQCLKLIQQSKRISYFMETHDCRANQ